MVEVEASCSCKPLTKNHFYMFQGVAGNIGRPTVIEHGACIIFKLGICDLALKVTQVARSSFWCVQSWDAEIRCHLQSSCARPT